MKKSIHLLTITLFAGALAASALAQGMPPEARANIHQLFDHHAAVKRTVTLTDTGYTALTESDDPRIAKALRAHVAQMRERLEAGMGVRRWDPAYDELVQHYKDLELKVEPTAKGLRVVMTGKTPAAVKIARNHAQIVSKFVEQGWKEHDVEHPAVAISAAVEGAQTEQGAACGARCGRSGNSSGQSGKCGGNYCRVEAKAADSR